jgi:hypothetical protein
VVGDGPRGIPGLATLQLRSGLLIRRKIRLITPASRKDGFSPSPRPVELGPVCGAPEDLLHAGVGEEVARERGAGHEGRAALPPRHLTMRGPGERQRHRRTRARVRRRPGGARLALGRPLGGRGRWRERRGRGREGQLDHGRQHGQAAERGVPPQRLVPRVPLPPAARGTTPRRAS